MSDAKVTDITAAKKPDLGTRLKELGANEQGRFWIVEANSTSPTTPVKVKLMQRAPGVQTNSPSLSRMLSFGTCIATPEAVFECAEVIMGRAGRMDEVTGVFA